jgi:hypothetical protein
MSNQTRIAWKEWQIDWACRLNNRLSEIMYWIDQHWPDVIVDPLFRVSTRIEDLLNAWFARAYAGSWSEIEMAWEFSDEDWLSNFQRMVAAGRILPFSAEDGI